MAGEMVEDYWYARTRDVPFSQYSSEPTIAQACADLSKLIRLPRAQGQWPDNARCDLPRRLSRRVEGALHVAVLVENGSVGAAQFPSFTARLEPVTNT
jgi:hypothetical protein